jgi:hypothetical protein
MADGSLDCSKPARSNVSVTLLARSLIMTLSVCLDLGMEVAISNDPPISEELLLYPYILCRYSQDAVW